MSAPNIGGKGLSPLVAAVLLIAITVAIGGLVSIFMSGFFKQQTSTAETLGTGTISCAGVLINIERVATGTPNTLLISNPSKYKVYVTSLFDNLGNTNTSASVVQALQPGLLTSVNVSNVPGATATRIDARGLCEVSNTNVSIEGFCIKGSGCWMS